MDRETEGQHSERPHPNDGVSTHTTRLAASKKTRTTLSEKIYILSTILVGDNRKLKLEAYFEVVYPLWVFDSLRTIDLVGDNREIEVKGIF